MNLVILAIVGFIALAFLVDAVRQTSKRKKKAAEPERILTADESGPTETGRYRAQQLLGKTSPPSGAPSPTAVPTGDDDEEPLPDPFGENEGDEKKGTES